MTTYTTITDPETAFKASVTISLMRRLRDNTLAIQQGDATAPNILLGVAAKATIGGVGTYAICRKTSMGVLNPGDTTAGGNLKYANVLGDTVATAISGTWMAMGYSAGSDVPGATTLFLRIS